MSTAVPPDSAMASPRRSALRFLPILDQVRHYQGTWLHPLVSTLGREPGTQVFRDLDTHPEDETTPGTVVLRMDGGVFFATADALVDQVRVAVLDPDVHRVVLHFAGVNFIDSQGAATVSEIIRMADASGVELRLAAVRPAVRRVLERQGAVELLGADHIHGNVHRAVAALGATRPMPVRPVREPGVVEEGERQ